MALFFVFLQNERRTFKKNGIYRVQPFANVFMYGGFGNSEFFCGGSHGGFVFDYVPGKR